MNYSIEADHKLKIIRYKHSGKLNQNDIDVVWHDLLKMKEFTHKGYNLFSDYRDAILDIPLSFLDELIDYMAKIRHIVKGKKQCLIVDDPQSTAASLLFENAVNAKVGFIVKVFSTEEAGLNWLVQKD